MRQQSAQVGLVELIALALYVDVRMSLTNCWTNKSASKHADPTS